MFMTAMRPSANEAVLDVGVNDMGFRESNFLEAMYPWSSQITAVALENQPTFQERFPEVTLVVGDGRRLPFADGAFDIGFSNAVVEHVGSREDQRQFVSELLRTCRRVFISTPNRRFPLEPHTMLPIVHWMPKAIREPIYRRTGNASWASEDALNPLSERDFRSLFPPGVELKLKRQRLMGLTSVLIGIAIQRR